MLQYIVKRKGLDFTEYGLVDATAIKRQKLGGASSGAAAQDTGHLCTEVLSEYLAWDASFKRSLESHKDGSCAIDLGELAVLCHVAFSGVCLPEPPLSCQGRCLCAASMPAKAADGAAATAAWPAHGFLVLSA